MNIIYIPFTLHDKLIKYDMFYEPSYKVFIDDLKSYMNDYFDEIDITYRVCNSKPFYVGDSWFGNSFCFKGSIELRFHVKIKKANKYQKNVIC